MRPGAYQPRAWWWCYAGDKLIAPPEREPKKTSFGFNAVIHCSTHTPTVATQHGPLSQHFEGVAKLQSKAARHTEHTRTTARHGLCSRDMHATMEHHRGAPVSTKPLSVTGHAGDDNGIPVTRLGSAPAAYQHRPQPISIPGHSRQTSWGGYSTASMSSSTRARRVSVGECAKTHDSDTHCACPSCRLETLSATPRPLSSLSFSGCVPSWPFGLLRVNAARLASCVASHVRAHPLAVTSGPSQHFFAASGMCGGHALCLCSIEHVCVHTSPHVRQGNVRVCACVRAYVCVRASSLVSTHPYVRPACTAC